MADYSKNLRNGVVIQKASLENKSISTVKEKKKTDKFLICFQPEDFILIDNCLDKASDHRIRINKSQVIRAALNSLSSMDKKEFLEAINKIRKV